MIFILLYGEMGMNNYFNSSASETIQKKEYIDDEK
jgi:hypothetical protein